MQISFTRSRRSRFARRLVPVVAALAVAAAACGPDDDAGTSPTAPPAAAGEAPATIEGSLRLGYFPNVTHAPALVGVEEGLFTKALGPGVDLETFTFNAGPEAIEAVFAGAVDITFIGPNPAINAHAKSKGEAIRIISGSTSGGAFLVVEPGIGSASDLKGTTLATPSLGNTQDVALRSWLADNGLTATKEGGGDVSILPQSNATTLESFIGGSIAGAWVPEPWATRLVDEGGGTVLVDERDLWPQTDGEYVTTHVIVRTAFLDEHPDIVRAFLAGLADSIERIAGDPPKARANVVKQIDAITGKSNDPAVVQASFANLTFTLDPIAASLQGSADDAISVGLLDPVDLAGIYDLSLLNEVLADRGKPAVQGL